jgi:hypothetical protein
MNISVPTNQAARLSLPAARLAIAAAAAALLLLASLHVLSPEFDPSWRMVSEYANGHYGWVLSLMFAAWGVSSWARLPTCDVINRALDRIPNRRPCQSGRPE